MPRQIPFSRVWAKIVLGCASPSPRGESQKLGFKVGLGVRLKKQEMTPRLLKGGWGTMAEVLRQRSSYRPGLPTTSSPSYKNNQKRAATAATSNGAVRRA